MNYRQQKDDTMICKDFRTFSKHIIISAFCILSLFGCSAGDDFSVPVPDDRMLAPYQPPQSTELSFADSLPEEKWWSRFQDKQLNTLIEELFTSSLPLEQARQRIAEVSARQGVIGADRQLQLAAALDYTHAETGDEAVSIQGLQPGKTLDVFSVGVTAGWELDLWGRTGRLLEAGEQDVRARIADYNGMLVSLAAELSLAYIDARTVEARMEMVRRNIALQQHSIKLARNRFEAGSSNELGVLRAERQLETGRAMIPELQRLHRLAVSRINTLLGQPPNTITLTKGEMPAVPELIGIGIPADLMTRRPDIQKALSAYHAAVARTGAAEAEQYPTLSLAGNITLSSDSFGGVFDADSLIYTLGPNITLPLFTGGRIKSNIAVRTSIADQARLAMEQKIIEALAEVENSAEGVVRTQERTIRLEEAGSLAEKQVMISTELYRAGLSDYFRVLDSERDLISTEESILLSRQQALNQVVGLYRALGGGWESAPPAISQSPAAAVQ